MTPNTTLDDGRGVERLFVEIRAYLAVVDAMRREGIEPRRASEPRSPSRSRRASGVRDSLFLKAVWGS
jgi:hypothetical protein